jgi:putative endonuclease
LPNAAIQMKTYAVYILSNTSRILYIGVTGDLDRRIWEHQKKLVPGFTATYNLHSMVYLELYANVKAAIAREKELKRWGRSKKLSLIRSANPNWTDLALNHFKNPKQPIQFPELPRP